MIQKIRLVGVDLFLAKFRLRFTGHNLRNCATPRSCKTWIKGWPPLQKGDPQMKN